MTFNVHSLLHLCDSCRKSGPLWASSAFPFESEIAEIKNRVSGPKGVADQVCDKLSERVSFITKLLKKNSDDISTQFCSDVLFNQPRIINYKRSDENAIVPTDKISIEKNEYNRIIFTKISFHSILYTRPQKTNNAFIQLLNEEIVEIQKFFFLENRLFMQIKRIDVNFVRINNIQLDHMFVISSKAEYTHNVSVNEIKKKLILVELENSLQFSCIPPPMKDVK